MVSLSNNPAYSVLRVKFKKVGDLQYISHLDLVRTMHKIIVRAGLPLWYTEGFNPKPKMAFAAPLSVGTESLCEFMDLRVTEAISPEEILARLNKNMTDEMQALEAYYPTTKLTELAYLSYTVTMHTVDLNAELLEKCREALDSPEMKIQKKTKSGEAIVDIKPLVKEAKLDIVDGELVLNCILSADPSAFLNPDLLVKYLKNTTGILTSGSLTEEWFTVLRKEAYTKDMQNFR